MLEYAGEGSDEVRRVADYVSNRLATVIEVSSRHSGNVWGSTSFSADAQPPMRNAFSWRKLGVLPMAEILLASSDWTGQRLMIEQSDVVLRSGIRLPFTTSVQDLLVLRQSLHSSTTVLEYMLTRQTSRGLSDL